MRILKVSTIMMGLAGSAVAAVAMAAPPAADAQLGKRLFLRCAACHAIAPGAPAKMGPNLYGVVGRKSGAVAGYRYSAAMQKAAIKWDAATLDKWLTRPAAVVPGTSMAFAGMAKPEERAAMIAYLKKPVP